MAIKDGIALGTFPPPPKLIRAENWRFGYDQLRNTVVGILQGRMNCTGQVTIDAGDSPLTVLDERVTDNSAILIMLASSDLANNFTYWISDVSNGSFVFEFTFGGQLTPTLIRYVIIG